MYSEIMGHKYIVSAERTAQYSKLYPRIILLRSFIKETCSWFEFV
jgi:hypothetical protein